MRGLKALIPITQKLSSFRRDGGKSFPDYFHPDYFLPSGRKISAYIVHQAVFFLSGISISDIGARVNLSKALPKYSESFWMAVEDNLSAWMRIDTDNDDDRDDDNDDNEIRWAFY